MAEPIDFQLDADGDLDLSTGDVVLTSGIDGVVQALRLALQHIKGEWFLDLDAGIDFFGEVLVKSPNLLAIREIFRREILAVPYVSDVLTMDFTFDRAARTAQLSFVAATDFGTTGEVTLEV